MSPGAEKQNQAWVERLYREKAADLILYGRALGLSHGEAEDVLQETFLALVQRVAPPVRPGHYAVRAYRNRALNYRRTLWRRVTRELESRSWFELGGGDDRMEAAAMQALAELPRAQREVIVLKVWHGCTFEEIAALVESSGNTVAGRYRYGMKRIKLRIEDIYERLEQFGEANAALAATPAVSPG